VAGAVIVLFALGLGYYLLSNTLDDREQQLADVQQQRELVEAQAATLQQYERLATDRARTEDLVQAVYAGRTLVADIIDAVSLVVPESVWFESLSMTTAEPTTMVGASGAASQSRGDSNVSIDGRTYTFEDVAQVLVRLQLVQALSEIDLGNAASEGDTGETKAFSIEATVVNTQDPDTPLPVSQVEVEGL
jgi:Tfp pilus assembly protein PilN